MLAGNGFFASDWWAARIEVDVVVLALSFLANLLYFAVDDVATQLEAPFGRDENE